MSWLHIIPLLQALKKTNESAATYLLLSARRREAINRDTEKKKKYTPSGKKKVIDEWMLRKATKVHHTTPQLDTVEYLQLKG